MKGLEASRYIGASKIWPGAEVLKFSGRSLKLHTEVDRPMQDPGPRNEARAVWSIHAERVMAVMVTAMGFLVQF